MTLSALEPRHGRELLVYFFLGGAGSVAIEATAAIRPLSAIAHRGPTYLPVAYLPSRAALQLPLSLCLFRNMLVSF